MTTTEPPPAPSRAKRTIGELLETVSPSRLITFTQCRLKFWFRYLSEIKKPKTAALHLGSAVHGVLKFWNRSRWHMRESSLKELHDQYRVIWETEQKKEPVQWELGEEPVQQQTGWRLLETYFRESPILPGEKPEAVEVNVEAVLPGMTKLVGVIDLVRSGGVIVDFKTTGSSPNLEKAPHVNELQTTSYSLLYREVTGAKESGVELHHLVKNKNPKLVIVPAPPANQRQVSRLHRVIDSYLNGLEQEDFIPSPGLQCASCEFFNECQLWS